MATSVNTGATSDKNKIFQGKVCEEFSEAEEVHKLIDSLKDVYKDNIATELVIERFVFIVDNYQEQPHLLDPHLQDLLTHLLKIASDSQVDVAVSHLAFKFLYLLTKARGYKVIVRFLPHEVPDLELVLALLAKQDPKDFSTWETRYILLLWLSIVCMIPFDMHRLDSNVVSEDGHKRAPIMLRILDAGKLYLDVSDKSRDAAAYMLSKFVTRPDVKKEQLPTFIDWCLTIMSKTDRGTISGMTILAGNLSTLALLLKHGKRDDVLPYATAILERLNSCKLFESLNNAIRKMSIKVVQRLGLTFMKAKVASWRYARGSRSLLHNLQVPSSQISSISASSKDIKVEEDEDYDIPEEMEEIVEHLLNGLRDLNTAVRWSAAKGIGRLTGRLPRELADDVVGSVLQLFSLQESDGAWHGGCLALAELGRRGLLLPTRLPDVVPVVLRALAYDEKRGAHSVGTHVRDAACYVCWSFARAYDPDVIQPYVNNIASALVITAIFDREVNCRYAASAAFQENVGRQGTFPHGIDILTLTDYYAVGNRTNTYINTSYKIAQFDEYTIPLIEHLYKIKSNHWDSVIRELTGQALHKLTPLAPEYMAKTVIPYLLPLTTSIDLNTRHGAVFALAEILHALYEHTTANSRKLIELVDSCVFEEIKGITKKMEKAMMFRGMSGELMRPAACFLIRKSAMSQLPFHDDPEFIRHWQDVLEDNIQCLQVYNPAIQVAAVAALPHFCNEYLKTEEGVVKPGIKDELVDRYVSELSNVSQFAKEGFAMALGSLPKFIVDGHFQKILLALIKTSKLTGKQQDDGKYAEARAQAIASISSLCETVGADPSGNPMNCVCADNVDMIYDCCLEAMKDYTTDNRGDVGVFVRQYSMASLEKVTRLLARSHPLMFSQQHCEKMMCCLVQQSCEKIDRMRNIAGKIILRLVYADDPAIPHIPNHQQIMEIFPKSDVVELNWAAPSDIFPKVTQLLKLDKYRYSVVLGLTVSVGGLTESLVKYSSQSLTGYLTSLKDMEELNAFADTLLTVFKNYQKVDRVSVAMLKMIDILLTHGCFSNMEDKDNPFPLALLDVSKKEISKTKDIQKMLCSIDVFCDLLQFKGDTHSKAFSQLLIFLGHKYPMIRKSAANKLYETLLMYDDLTAEENQDEILTILGDTMWDDDNMDNIREIRNKLCDLVGIARPKLVSGVKKPAVDRSNGDDMDTYKDLLGRVGY